MIKKKKEKVADAEKKETSKSKMSWAKLLKRVFDFEVDACRCGGKLRIISTILNQEVAIAILQSLKIEVYYPESLPARGSPTLFDDYSEVYCKIASKCTGLIARKTYHRQSLFT